MKRVAVLGLGAVGTVFATFLKEYGHTVYGIVKDDQAGFFKGRKLNVSGIWGDHEVVLDGIFTDISKLKEYDIDLFIVAVKSYDTENVAKSLKDVVGKNAFVLLTQNGYGNYEKTLHYIPKERILIGRVIFGAKVEYPSKAVITVNADDVRIGHPENLAQESKVLEIVCSIKHSGIPASYSRDINKILWEKIIYNCALNPLGALLEKSYGELAEGYWTNLLINQIVREIFEVCRLNSIQLSFESPDDYLDHFYKNLIPPTKDHYPSMYYDLKADKRTEIEALNGSIVKLGEKFNYTPFVNLTLTTIIKERKYPFRIIE